jgi:Flp pilus assembly protein TadB
MSIEILRVPIVFVATLVLARLGLRSTRRAFTSRRLQAAAGAQCQHPVRHSQMLHRLPRLHRRSRSELDLLEALAMIARSIHSGSSMSIAIGAAAQAASYGRVGNGLRQVVSDATRIGLVEALRAWGEADPVCARTAWALSIAAETGGDPLAAVDALTSSLRSEGALSRELGALTAQSTLSAAVLAVVPIGFGGLLSGTDPQARHFLFWSPAGRACFVVGLLLDLIAWRWLRKIGKVTI